MQLRTEHIKEKIVQYIRDNKLSMGDKLPSQKVLREYCNTGGSTMTAAINQLKLDGILKVRPHVGIFVLDPNADGHISRRIGVLSKIPVFNPFQAMFLEYLEFFMRRENSHTIKFWRIGSSFEKNQGFKEYPGLKRMMLDGNLDALIVVQQPLADEIETLAKKLNIPILGYAVDNMGENMITYDYDFLIKETVSILRAKNCKRPIMFSVNTLQNNSLYDKYKEAMMHLYPAEMDLVSKENIFIVHDMDVRHNNLQSDITKRIAEISSWPAERHPDCLIIFDDIIAGWINEIMLQTKCQWHPELLILNNKQLPLHIVENKFGSWMLDIAEHAKSVVDNVLLLLCSDVKELPVIYIKPCFVD